MSETRKEWAERVDSELRELALAIIDADVGSPFGESK